MILLDTNVLSGPTQRAPNQQLVAWLDAQPGESIWTTAITVFEVRMGLELLTPGQRRRQPGQAFDQLLAEHLEGRIQTFDQTAGTIAASRQRAGRTLEMRDLQIVGIATARRASAATQNVRHFEGLGLDVIDP